MINFLDTFSPVPFKNLTYDEILECPEALPEESREEEKSLNTPPN